MPHNPPLPIDNGVVTHAPMDRSKQTWLIVSAIFGAVGLYFAYDSITNPNLDGLTDSQRCSYWAYYHNHGGDPGACKNQAVTAIEARVNPDANTYAANIEAEEQQEAAQPVAPTKF